MRAGRTQPLSNTRVRQSRARRLSPRASPHSSASEPLLLLHRPPAACPGAPVPRRCPHLRARLDLVAAVHNQRIGEVVEQGVQDLWGGRDQSRRGGQPLGEVSRIPQQPQRRQQQRRQALAQICPPGLVRPPHLWVVVHHGLGAAAVALRLALDRVRGQGPGGADKAKQSGGAACRGCRGRSGKCSKVCQSGRVRQETGSQSGQPAARRGVHTKKRCDDVRCGGSSRAAQLRPQRAQRLMHKGQLGQWVVHGQQRPHVVHAAEAVWGGTQCGRA